MESLLHYCWKHKLFSLRPLEIADGRKVEVLNPGIHNHDAGPDFLEAKVKVDGVLWVGNVEIHTRTSDWHRHNHDGNPAYDNVILHVVECLDDKLYRQNGDEIPQMVIDVPDFVRMNYDQLLAHDTHPRCKHVIPYIPRLLQHSWLNVLQIERLEQRTRQIMERRERLNLDWENVFFVTFARSLGFGKNSDAMEEWAYNIPLSAVGKHRNDLFQVQAIFYGQAGFFEDGFNSANWDVVSENPKLRSEYKYLRQKFSLKPVNPGIWKFMRLRPQNSPVVRVGQLAQMYFEQRISLSKVLNCGSVESLIELLGLTKFTANNIIINAIIPVMFAYGKYRSDELLCQQALAFFEQAPAEDNHIVREWKDAGIRSESAADSQALIQLNNNYCSRRDCLRCRFGYEFIKRTPSFLNEKTK